MAVFDQIATYLVVVLEVAWYGVLSVEHETTRISASRANIALLLAALAR